MQGAAVAHRDIPEAAGGELRHQHHAAADPQRGEEGIRQCIGVEQRHRRQVHVVAVHVHVQGVDPRRPKGIAVGEHHALRPRGGAGGVLHVHRPQRIDIDAAALGSGLGVEQCGEGFRPGRQVSRYAGIVLGADDPAQVATHPIEAAKQARLGDRHAALAVSGVVVHLLRRGAGVGVDRHGAQFAAGSPGDEELRAVLQVDQHPVALLHPARRERGGDAAHRVVELRVAVGRRRAVEGFPDHQRLVAMGGGLGCQQPVEVLAGEGIAETLRGHVRLNLIVVGVANLSGLPIAANNGLSGTTGGAIRPTRPLSMNAGWSGTRLRRRHRR
ncbi:hypothetical protein D3C76_544130 [compost metagenome]